MVVICLLRGINVGGHHQIKMDHLRGLCESLKLGSPKTYVQSGNVVFTTKERDLPRLARRIEDKIEQNCGFRPAVILRTASEWANVIARNPFAKRRDIEPGKLLVNFLADTPTPAASEEIRKIEIQPEELKIDGRELYIYFPNGMGRSKFPWSRIDKLMKTTGTGRNWNTVTKLMEMAHGVDGA